jgi:hypothetical protein
MLRRRLKIKSLFSKEPRAWLWLLIGILFIFNILLLTELNRVQIENGIWKSKVNLSLADQISLMEHSLEGEFLGNEINLLSKLESAGQGFTQKQHGLRIIYSFRGMTCDNCLTMEIEIFQTEIAELKALDVTPIMVFGNIEKAYFARLVKSMNIEANSIRDEGNVLVKRFAKITTPIVLLINSKGRVLVANISDYRDRDKSIRFYEKVFAVANQI